jgi:amino acid adenylation domain-containing protein
MSYSVGSRPQWRNSGLANPYPDVCIHELFTEVAQERTQQVAVDCNGKTLTYSELDFRSSRWARALQERGLGPDMLVGLCVGRSVDMVAALLAILKAGGAYVPLDPTHPKDRIGYILDDANVKLVLTEENLRDSFPLSRTDILTLDSLATSTALPSESTAEAPNPSNLAYVIYTSGSTGRPKGVQIEHRSMVNFLTSMRREPGFTENDILLAVTTLSFDIAGLEIYLPLLCGGRLAIATKEDAQDGRRLSELLRSSGATVMQATPATWRLLIESGWTGTPGLRILCGGEALPVELARELVKRSQSVWNLYGPTETTIWSSLYRVHGQEQHSVPIGRPIANTQLFVLDEKREQLGRGQAGELCISGAGIARGYLKRPELTAEKFIPDPFSGVPGARLYRTGDLARLGQEGEMEYLGRMDHQVKIRGYRIELGEIESVFEQHIGIRQAVVTAREEKPGDKYLAAYVVLANGARPSIAELREHLLRSLPDYMVPAAIIELAEIPLNTNGKVDRKALPPPAISHFTGTHDCVAPRNDTERKLVAMWEKILSIRPIGVTTSFFDLGGRSVLAAQLFMQISRAFHQDVPLAALFEAPTVEQLARRLRGPKDEFTYATIVEIHPVGSRVPFFCVHGGTGGTLFLHRLARTMGPDQPFYAFQPEGVDGGPITRRSIEEMAAHYIREMRKVHADGPYFIGGYCLGGNVAFEMARQLKEQGRKAALVAMFSAQLRFNRPPGERAFVPERRPEPRKKPRKRSLVGKIKSAVRWRAEDLFYKSRTIIHKTGCRVLNRAGISIPQSWRELYLVRALTVAEKNYHPQFFDGRIVLFRGAGLYDHDPGMGWSQLAREIEDCRIGTPEEQKTRRDILNDPLVEQVAARLSSLITPESPKKQVSPVSPQPKEEKRDAA